MFISTDDLMLALVAFAAIGLIVGIVIGYIAGLHAGWLKAMLRN